MLKLVDNIQRRTTTDMVFDQLHQEISTLELLPGTKLSEADVAQRYGVSRQPVRDAFSRLENLDLLLIRPQRATEVRGFSLEHIAHARFVRRSVEIEVINYACSIWDEARAEVLEQSLQQQQQAVNNKNSDEFQRFDYEFHKMICELSDCAMAFETIKEFKSKVDRLCMLSLGRGDELSVLLDDHKRLANALKNRSTIEATEIARQHFARLDDTIADIHRKHSNYFE